MKFLGFIFVPLISGQNLTNPEMEGFFPVEREAFDAQNTSDNDMRQINSMGTFLAYMLCPPGNPNNPDWCNSFPVTVGNDKIWSPKHLVNTVMTSWGCNCFPQNKALPFEEKKKRFSRLAPGTNGEPVDGIDQACTVLAKRNRCILMDNAEASSGMTLGKCDYTYPYHFYYNPDTFVSICGPRTAPQMYTKERLHTDERYCQRDICFADRELAESVVSFLESKGMNLLEYYITYRGQFQRSTDDGSDLGCVPKDLNVEKDQCCGTFIPAGRSPFDSATQKCCNDQVVNIGSEKEQIYCY